MVPKRSHIIRGPGANGFQSQNFFVKDDQFSRGNRNSALVRDRINCQILRNIGVRDRAAQSMHQSERVERDVDMEGKQKE